MLDAHDVTSPGRPGVAVTVAVLTFRRPDDLAELLPLLVAQATPWPDVVSLLVVDNDPDAGARSAVESFALDAAVAVRYVHEPSPGIAAARNRALDEAAADVLVFIDDDERPAPAWLEHLLTTHQSTGASAVVGPVVSRFDVEPDAWVQAGDFFERRRPPTGTALQVAATNNLLLTMAQVNHLGLRFDERFGLSGGSDTLFTRQLVQRGGSMVWCDEALVVDVVPAQRVTRGWVLRRALRSGNSWSRTTIALAGTAPQRLAARGRLLVLGSVRAVGGSLRAVAGILAQSPRHQARGARTAVRGAGMVSGALGGAYVEYRRSDSSS